MVHFDNARMLCASAGSVNSIFVARLRSLFLCGNDHKGSFGLTLAFLCHILRLGHFFPLPTLSPKIAFIRSFNEIGRRPGSLLLLSPHVSGKSLPVVALRARAGPQGQKG